MDVKQNLADIHYSSQTPFQGTYVPLYLWLTVVLHLFYRKWNWVIRLFENQFFLCLFRTKLGAVAELSLSSGRFPASMVRPELSRDLASDARRHRISAWSSIRHCTTDSQPSLLSRHTFGIVRCQSIFGPSWWQFHWEWTSTKRYIISWKRTERYTWTWTLTRSNKLPLWWTRARRRPVMDYTYIQSIIYRSVAETDQSIDYLAKLCRRGRDHHHRRPRIIENFRVILTQSQKSILIDCRR